MKHAHVISTNEKVVGEGHSLREEMAGEKLSTIGMYTVHFTVQFAADTTAHASKIIQTMEDGLQQIAAPEKDIKTLWSLTGRAEVTQRHATDASRMARRAAAKRRKK